MLRRCIGKCLTSARLQSSAPKRGIDFLQATPTVASELSNGLRVATVSNGKPISTIGVWIESGSRFETPDTNGVSSLLEHLTYKGTTSRSGKQLEADLAKYGARLNSFVTRDHTVYLVQVVNENVNQVLDILADVLRHPKFDAEAVEIAKQNLIKQLEEVESNSEEVVLDMLHTTAFQGTPLGLSLYGKVASLNKLTREDVINFADDHLKGARVVIAAAGGVDHSAINSFAAKNFGDLDNTYKRKVPLARGTRFTSSDFVYRDDTYPLMHAAIAVEGVSIDHPDALALKLAAQYVGQWDISHGSDSNAPVSAVQDISDATDVQKYFGFSVNYSDTGLFGFYFASHGENIDHSMNICGRIQRKWKHLATSVTDEELDRSKSMLRTQLLEPLEDNANLAHYLAVQTLGTGKAPQVADLDKNIRHIHASDVREAVSRHVYDRDVALSGVGRTEAIPALTWVRQKQSWWRL